jgi:DNA polymerase-3 subunit alpha
MSHRRGRHRIKRQVSKRSGAEFARLTVEDFSGSSEVLVFPRTGLCCRTGSDRCPLLVRGGYSRRDQGADNPTFIIESVQRFEELRIAGQVTVASSWRAVGMRESVNGRDPPTAAVGNRTPLLPEVMQDVRAVAEAHPARRRSKSDGMTETGRRHDCDRARSSCRQRIAALTELRALLGQGASVSYAGANLASTPAMEFERPIFDSKSRSMS